MAKPEGDERTQFYIDFFYLKKMNKKPCCAGCDYWRWISVCVGECSMSKLVSEKERYSILGITDCSVKCEGGAGHVLTSREYSCGLFKDTFDWDSVIYKLNNFRLSLLA